MSTRSNIAVENPDGTVEVVYCHFDGYPSGVGRECLMHGREEIRAIIAKGDMSSFGEHYRDRGEEWDDVKPRQFSSIRDWLEAARRSSADYCYVLTAKGVWKYSSDFSKLVKLTPKNTSF